MNTDSISDEEAKKTTIQSYNNHIDEYIAKVDNADERTVAYWPGIKLFLDNLPRGQKIFEIGSGSGSDALRIEDKGFKVRRSDITQAFLKTLTSAGHKAEYYDALEGSVKEKQMAIFANAVFLHFTLNQFRMALTNVNASLADGGLFCIGMKLGDFEGWRKKGLTGKRYFKFWELNHLKKELQEAGFAISSTYVTPDKDFTVVTAKKVKANEQLR